MAESSPIRILVVDDERFSLAVIEASLNGIDDCVVETCRSGQDALESAPTFKPDLLILDVMMPGMNGPETLAALRELPDTESTPVIFMTATTPVHNAADYDFLGANAVIAKPIRRDTLIATIDEVSLQHGVSPAPRAGREIDFVMPDDLATEYVAAIPEQVQLITTVWENFRGDVLDDIGDLQDRVHKIAGTAASYGFAELGEIAAALERLVFGIQPGTALDPDQIDRIQTLIHRLETASTELGA